MRRALIALPAPRSSPPSLLSSRSNSARLARRGGGGGGGVRGAHAAVLVRVGGDVGDEFLGCETEEALQGEGGGGGGEAGEEEVVRCYGVGDLGVLY